MHNMKQFVITPQVLGLGDGVVSITDPVDSREPVEFDYVDAVDRNPVREALDIIRQPVLDIVTKYNGSVENDASGFGVPEHPGQFSSFMVVTIPAQAVAELVQLDGIAAITENAIVGAEFSTSDAATPSPEF